MTRILLDECLPVKLRYRFQEFDESLLVSTVTNQSWNGIKNGKLLDLVRLILKIDNQQTINKLTSILIEQDQDFWDQLQFAGSKLNQA